MNEIGLSESIPSASTPMDDSATRIGALTTNWLA